MRARPILPALMAIWMAGCAGAEPTAPPTAQDPGAGADTGVTPPAGTTLTYRYGAKFEPPMGRVVHGLGQWQAYNAKYAALFPAANQPASELFFLLLTDTVRAWNPALIAAQLAAIDARGRIPLADISLRGNQPTKAELDLLADKLYAADDEIAHTTKWDSRIADVANVLKAFRKPVMLRIGGEFNGSWNGYHPYDYPVAFRKIVARIREAGADNVAFVWCYEPAAPGDFYDKNAAGAYKWYPGDDVVDWFSVDLFAVADVSPSTPVGGHGGAAPQSPYARVIQFLDLAVAKGRPVVIAESSPSHIDVAAAGASAWADWFTPYFGLIAARPEIEWFVYISFDWTTAGHYADNGWKNNDLSSNAALAGQYAGEIAKPKYLHAGELALLKDYGKYK